MIRWMQRQNFCMACDEQIHNPICLSCLALELKSVFRDINSKRINPEETFRHLRLMSDECDYENKCLLCRRGAPNICSSCFVGEINRKLGVINNKQTRILGMCINQ